MASRLELQAELEELMENRNVYFQPPASVRLSYPCVIYNVGNGDARRANDSLYKFVNSYDLIFIFKKPNVEIIETVLKKFPMCRCTRTYCADNLNHYAFTLYY